MSSLVVGPRNSKYEMYMLIIYWLTDAYNSIYVYMTIRALMGDNLQHSTMVATDYHIDMYI